MTRIVAGKLGGRRLDAPVGQHTRPTSDRVREGLFNTLESLTDLAGSRFADLYAGSGAVGLEACSRGADQVLLVESDPMAARTARANIAALGVGQTVHLVVRNVEAVVAAGPGRPGGQRAGEVGGQRAGEVGGPFHVVFADPPYAMTGERLVAVQQALVDEGWLAAGGILAIERASRSGPVSWVQSVTGLRTRRYGETTLWYGQRS